MLRHERYLKKVEKFGITDGLGLIQGRIEKLESDLSKGERLPHVSWNEIKEPFSGRWENRLLENTGPLADVYFVHSFVAKPKEPDEILATANYGNVNFCAAVAKGKNIYGTEFHPKKKWKSWIRNTKEIYRNKLKNKIMSKYEAFYGLPSEVKFWKKCVISNSVKLAV